MASNDMASREEKTLEGEDSSDSGSPEPNSEEAIFSLLFQQCDSDASGLVQVDQLVEFIRSVQMGGSHPGDQVYDSHSDVSKLQYNLHLLKAMLECNAVDGLVDQSTYSHIIKMWVKDVRGRTLSSPPPSPPLEVSQLSDSEAATGEWSYSEHSLEASGGQSSQHSLSDRLELMNSVADLRLENKRLSERNTSLQVQMDGSEENLKQLQSQNEALKQDIKTVQSTLCQLNDLEIDNASLLRLAEDMKGQVSVLSSRVGELERELSDAQGEISIMSTQLTNGDVDKEAVEEDNRALQLLLEEREQVLSQQETKQSQLEAQLNDLQHNHSELSQTIADLTEANENLRTENADLHAHDPPLNKPLFPLSSTPHRAPSWHDELSAHDSLIKGGSPIRADNGRMDPDSFSKLIQETSVKFNSTTNKMVSELSDLINQPSPVLSRRGNGDTHTLTCAERLNERSFQAFESKLSDILRQKKQLQNENIELLATVEDLKAKLAEQALCVVALSQEVATQVSPSPTHESAVQTDLTQQTSLDQAQQTSLDQQGEAQQTRDQAQQTSLDQQGEAQQTSQDQQGEEASLDQAQQTSLDQQGEAQQTSLDQAQQISLHQQGEASLDQQGEASLDQAQQISLDQQGEAQQTSLDPQASHQAQEFSRVHETLQLESSVPKATLSRSILTHHNIEAVDFDFGQDASLEDTSHVTLVGTRIDELAGQCGQLEMRAAHLERTKQSSCSRIGSAVVQILKAVTFALCLSLLVMLLLLATVICYDQLNVCGPYCRHSPLGVLYSTLNPHFHYRSLNKPI